MKDPSEVFHRAKLIVEQVEPYNDDDGSARRQIKAEALRDAANDAPPSMGDHEFRDWLRDQANALVTAIQKRGES